MITEQQMKELRERNEVRLKEAKEKLGSKWLLHPENKVKTKSTLGCRTSTS